MPAPLIADGGLDWSAWVGLPYLYGGRGRDGVDCWGLVRLVLAEASGLDLPLYPIAGPAAGLGAAGTGATLRERAALLRGAAVDWHEVTGQPRPLDVVLLLIGRLPAHIGLVVRPGWMLHCDSVPGLSLLERYGQASRYRPAGIWRHPGMAR